MDISKSFSEQKSQMTPLRQSAAGYGGQRNSGVVMGFSDHGGPTARPGMFEGQEAEPRRAGKGRDLGGKCRCFGLLLII